MPLVEITCGMLTEQQRRQIAKGIGQVLIENGQPEHAITMIFRHVTGPEVAIGAGVFPYWPEKKQEQE